MKGKRGAENTFWIILALLFVLAVAVIGFYFLGGGTFKFSDFWSNLFGKENIDTVKTGCETACATVGTNAWCSQGRAIRFNYYEDPLNANTKQKLYSITLTCDQWQKGTFGDVTETVDSKLTDNAKTAIAATDVLKDKITSCASITC